MCNKSLINNYNTYNLSRLAVAQADLYFSKLSALSMLYNKILHCQFHAKRGAFNLGLLGVPQVKFISSILQGYHKTVTLIQ